MPPRTTSPYRPTSGVCPAARNAITDSPVTATLFSDASNDPSAFCCFARYARPVRTAASAVGCAVGVVAGAVCARAGATARSAATQASAIAMLTTLLRIRRTGLSTPALEVGIDQLVRRLGGGGR